MRRLLASGLAAGLSLGAVAATGLGSATAAPSDRAVAVRNSHVCSAPSRGDVACLAIRHDRIDSSGKVIPNVTPSGFGPADIQAAYGLASTASPLVAIVDAYDLPTAEKDLGTYRSAFGLSTCTTANGCFKKVGQTGTSVLPRANAGWGQEIALDLDMVSAACPTCRILLVEAKSASFSNLAIAVATAARLGAVAISNSYGGGDLAELSAYNQPGVAVTASTGDNGYGVSAPASFPHVIAVGGTSLTKTNGVFSERAWSGAGSGCSTKNAKPSWQTAVTSCTGKANADISAVADPATGVAVYDSTAYQGYSGWMVFGGTSASSPIIASAYALGGNHGTSYPASWTWGHASALHDVTSGSNGTCATAVWCAAGTGWDGPTGLGTPNGLAAL